LIDTISVVMIVKDAEKTIEKTLKSLQEFKEIILYLNNSTDDTDLLAQNYTNVTIVKGDFFGFGPTKNRAASYASSDWIFSLDADEVVTEEFVESMKNIKLDDQTIYTILRSNFYQNREIKYCWGNDIITRLYHRKITQFTDKKVHEKIIDNGFKVTQIDGLVNHYPYSTISDFIVKLDRYSTIYAEDNVGKKSSSPTKAILNASFSFFKTYFLKRGFLDGYAGLVIAFSHMATNFYKYIKLYEKNRDLEKS